MAAGRSLHADPRGSSAEFAGIRFGLRRRRDQYGPSAAGRRPGRGGRLSQRGCPFSTGVRRRCSAPVERRAWKRPGTWTGSPERSPGLNNSIRRCKPAMMRCALKREALGSDDVDVAQTLDIRAQSLAAQGRVPTGTVGPGARTGYPGAHTAKPPRRRLRRSRSSDFSSGSRVTCFKRVSSRAERSPWRNRRCDPNHPRLGSYLKSLAFWQSRTLAISWPRVTSRNVRWGSPNAPTAPSIRRWPVD